MMKCPGRQLRAMSGAYTSRQNTFSETCVFLRILFISVFVFGLYISTKIAIKIEFLNEYSLK